jgi:hypothetical protein
VSQREKIVRAVRFPANAGMTKQLLLIGEEQNPLLIIDNFMSDPSALRSLAAEGDGFVAQDSDFYPGQRKPAPAGYAESLQQTLEADIKKIFSDQASSERELVTDLSVFSLVTTPEKQLRPIQCVPHIDTHHRHHLAAVHYLCDEKFGGTSFYCHRSTGYESIDEQRLKDYFPRLKSEVIREGEAALRYMNGSTALFERIASIPLKFNRLILYRSNCLHAGDIDPAQGLEVSPETGRLTINSFLRC